MGLVHALVLSSLLARPPGETVTAGQRPRPSSRVHRAVTRGSAAAYRSVLLTQWSRGLTRTRRSSGEAMTRAACRPRSSAGTLLVQETTASGRRSTPSTTRAARHLLYSKQVPGDDDMIRPLIGRFQVNPYPRVIVLPNVRLRNIDLLLLGHLDLLQGGLRPLPGRPHYKRRACDLDNAEE
jgi:hypothetical protein